MVLPRPPWPTTVHHVKLGVRARHLQGCAHCFYQHDTAAASDGTVRKQLKVIRLAACMVAFYTGKNRAHFNHYCVHCMITDAGQQFLTQHSGTGLDRHHTTSTKHVTLPRHRRTRGLTWNGASTSMRRSNVGKATSSGMRLMRTLPVPACSHTCAAQPHMALEHSCGSVLWAVMLRRTQRCNRKHHLAHPSTQGPLSLGGAGFAPAGAVLIAAPTGMLCAL